MLSWEDSFVRKEGSVYAVRKTLYRYSQVEGSVVVTPRTAKERRHGSCLLG